MGLETITTLNDYLIIHGQALGRKAMDSLQPLHVPGETDLADNMDQFIRPLMEAQAHVVTAVKAMMDKTGNGFLCGECGVGKSIIGIAAAHLHAGTDKYRGLILCPDHLIGKWIREIETTIPGAKAFRFGAEDVNEDGSKKERSNRSNSARKKGQKAKSGTHRTLTDLVALIDKGHRFRRDVNVDGHTHTVERAAWDKPTGPEWYVLGRNQAKWDAGRISIGDLQRGFDGEMHEHGSSKVVIVAREAKKDDLGKEIKDRTGNRVMVPVIDRHYFCPKCGTVVRNKDGTAVGIDTLRKKAKDNPISCEGFYLQEVRDPESQSDKRHNLDRVYSVIGKPYDSRGKSVPGKNLSVNEKWTDARPGQQVKWNNKLWEVVPCGNPLWNWVPKPYRWSPARLIQRKFKGAFKYLLVDEVHEQKSDEAAQANAAGKLMSCVDHVLALTGTLIGGYAVHLMPLMLRMTPASLTEEGFAWGKPMPFSQAYGKVDRIVTTRFSDGGTEVKGRGRNSMRRCSTGGKSTQDEAVRPGFMPTLFGRHMIGNSVFLTLEELAADLPGFHEYVGGPLRDRYIHPVDPDKNEPLESYEHYKRLWVDTAVDMDDEQRDEYTRIEGDLVAACRELLKKGSMKLLGAMNATLMGYPDKPYGYVPDFPGEHAVGYFVQPKINTQANWMGVTSPVDLDKEVIRPKEQALIDVCRLNKDAGNQCWVFCQMTDKRDVMPRLRSILEANGLKVGVLKAGTVPPQQREEWITRNCHAFDVVLSHPKLVSTGLDLFAVNTGTHNFNTLVFYQTGYNLFDMRQASRRSWRIGQPKECQVYYLYYKGGFQQRAMNLMSRKMAASINLEGEFSSEGFAAMSGEDNAQMALAARLSETIDPKDIQRNWGKLSSGGKKKGQSPLATKDWVDVAFSDSTMPMPGQPSPFDNLPDDVALMAETVLDGWDADDDEELMRVVNSYKPEMKLVGTAVMEPPRSKAMTREQVARFLADMEELGIDPEDLL